jgi:hypothetical protein
MVTQKTTYSGDGTSKTVEMFFDGGITPKAALATLDYPNGKRCQHEWDCCGGWYAGAATAEQRGSQVVVTQLWRKNI